MTDTRYDIWKVLEHYGWSLPNPRGVWQSVRCGAHDDHHASCRINSESGFVKCLACDLSGDAIDIVKHYEGLGFRDAVRRCEEITGGSGRDVSQSNRYGRSVSQGKRFQQRSRKYTPPRLRRGADDRA